MACFAGRYDVTVDGKRRLGIPSACMMELFMDSDKYTGDPDHDAVAFKAFKESGPLFHITAGKDHYLIIDPRETFKKKAERIRREYGHRNADSEARRYMHEIMNAAQPVKCDKQGRLTVPARQLEYAGIQEDAVIIGMFDYLEVWDPKLYETYMNGGTSTSEERIEKFGWVEKEPDAAGADE